MANNTSKVYAVLEICVLISALRSSHGGGPGVAGDSLLAGRIRLAISVAALATEYEEVALRPGLIPALAPSQIIKIVDGLCHLARNQKIFLHLVAGG